MRRPPRRAKMREIQRGAACRVYLRMTARAAGTLQRAPLFERLIARASRSSRGIPWRAEAFRAIAADEPLPAVGSAALAGAGAVAVGAAWVCVASPLHLVAGMKDVMMQDDGLLTLDPGEAAALAVDFNRVFADESVRLVVGRGEVLLCVFDGVLDVATRDPEDMVGRDVFDFQATGRDAARVRRLMSEMEMWLFDHAVNRARAAQGAVAISSLWLWGGGPVLTDLPRVSGWTAGRDPLFSAFGAAAQPGATSGVVVCESAPGALSWPEEERRWLQPALAALRAGRIESLALSMGDVRFDVQPGWRLRFWRRATPWWESFESERG